MAEIDYLVSNMNHLEYQTTMGDRFFEIGKKLIPNPEQRHNLLNPLAKFMSLTHFLRGRLPELKTTLHFHDKSIPITFQSPIILAAGGNKTAQNLQYYHAMGFGGVTVGTATLKGISGNPFRPRLRMLPQDLAIQNSMGLNNPGIDKIAHRVDFQLGRCHKEQIALGISVADTPGITDTDKKIEDLLTSFRKAYQAADYVEINVSCPNTGKNRIDWQKDFLKSLLNEVMHIRNQLAPRKAVFVKLSPDMSQNFLDKTLQVISDSGVTGLVLFNTFPSEKTKYLNMKTSVEDLLPVTETGRKGGISGQVLYQNTLPAVKFIKKNLPQLSVIAVGGIDTGSKVLNLLEAGADAVQCYTVLAYRWNAIHKMNKELLVALREKGIDSIAQLQP